MGAWTCLFEDAQNRLFSPGFLVGTLADLKQRPSAKRKRGPARQRGEGFSNRISNAKLEHKGVVMALRQCIHRQEPRTSTCHKAVPQSVMTCASLLSLRLNLGWLLNPQINIKDPSSPPKMPPTLFLHLPLPLPPFSSDFREIPPPL